ncbi:unnamed protein product [Oppiella nova]|uniref:legumain n=1 Tax=Oppiella nova TaxID=334625 RepID=A0A7R9QHT5_9ACAR|nr:unnamed protein product [Oppiella nova]CAG2166035.1 unnamed protein product [Oppiella nova]
MDASEMAIVRKVKSAVVPNVSKAKPKDKWPCHRSNVYHAYQIIKSHGIPDTNIVVMHYDDLANNKANPTPGIVINVPNGPDVYKGVPKDYTGADVNPLNFLAVLRGDPILARNHKKVIKSGPNDHIYVYFIDHGAPDLIAFPTQYLYGEELNAQFKQMYQDKKYAKLLNAQFKQMYQDKKYAKLVINIEACNSGSMFEKLLPNDINVYTTTSANPQESSYAKDYDSKLKTYLGDYYSGAWLQVIEKEDLNVETLDQSYKYTVTSQNIRNVPIALAEKLIESTEDINEKQRYVTELQRLLSGRQYMDKHFADFVNSIKHLIDTKNIDVLNGQESLNNRECYRKFVDIFNEKCFNINQNTYAFGKLQTFVNICENLIEPSYVDNAVEHLANVYHAYQIVKSHGIPQKNIIVFHYDDLAYNKVNPTPGIVVNTLDGPDVYHGVPKDYTGHEVNPMNFVGVLKGDKTLKKNNKKVLESGPNDHVYIYFIDHGDDDVILFPTEYLYGEELNEALKYMHQNHMFAKLVFNMETCHSGSMFEKLLPKDINVYVTTSTKPDELSYVTYYDKLRKTYLGDYYSGAWLENSETQDLDKETLQAQFEYLSKNVTTSTPQQYGDVSIAKLPVSQFFGNKPTGYIPSKQVYNNDAEREVVNPRDIPVLLAQKNIASTNDINEKQKYAKELETILKGREYVDNVFNEYVNSFQCDSLNVVENREKFNKVIERKDIIGVKLPDTQEAMDKYCAEEPYVTSTLGFTMAFVVQSIQWVVPYKDSTKAHAVSGIK